MLFWIFVILFVICLALTILGANSCNFYWEDVTAFFSVLFGVVVAIMLIAICVEYTNVDGYIAKMNVRRETLVWQLENDIYENDNDLGKYDLMSKIQDWNEDLAYYQEVQDSFWTGIFHVNIYDQFEPIPLE